MRLELITLRRNVLNKKALVREYAVSHRYFTLEEIMRVSGVSVQIAKNYLHELKQQGIVFPAGKGIYSSVAKVFTPDEKNRVVEIRQMLKKEFPYLDFIIWNTICFQPYYHHQQTHHITFVEVEYDGVHSVFERISRDYRHVLIEKTSRVPPDSFDITRNPIVVRLLIKGSPRDGHAATLEKMLVDLFVIKDKYFTMPNADYWELWKSIDDFYRVNVGDIVRYAKSRRYFRDLLSQFIENIGFSGVTFGAYLEYAAKVTSEKDGYGKTNS